MADFTYAPAPVLIESTGEFALGVVGAFTDAATGTTVQAYDLNDSPIGGILVGPKGAHQAFKADIPHGILDFGSVLLPSESIEQQEAGFIAVTTADTALANSTTAIGTANSAMATANEALDFAQAGPVAAVEAAATVNPAGAWDFDVLPLVGGSPIVQNATETDRGIAELATTAEALTGTDTGRVITPAGLKAGLDTKSSVGHTHVATADLTATGTKDSSTFLRGDNTWAAPTGVTAPDASETVKGIVELATTTEVQTGTDTVRAVTPAGLAARTATDTRTGVVELATTAEATTGTDTARAVTPAGVKAVGDTKLGIVSGSGLTDAHKVTQATYDGLGSGRPAGRIYFIVG